MYQSSNSRLLPLGSDDGLREASDLDSTSITAATFVLDDSGVNAVESAVRISWLLKFGMAMIALIVSGEVVGQGGSDYRFEVKTIPPGAAVFSGKTFKGVTPYESEWVKKPTEVSYTLVKGGYKVETVQLKGGAESLASANVTLTPASDLSLAQANLLLEAIRASLAETEPATEVEAGFPKIGPFLSEDFKRRISRMFRMNKTVPLPDAAYRQDGKIVEHMVWRANEISKQSPTERSVGAFIGTSDGGGERAIMLFTNHDGVWLVSNYLSVGQDSN